MFVLMEYGMAVMTTIQGVPKKMDACRNLIINKIQARAPIFVSCQVIANLVNHHIRKKCVILLIFGKSASLFINEQKNQFYTGSDDTTRVQNKSNLCI